MERSTTPRVRRESILKTAKMTKNTSRLIPKLGSTSRAHSVACVSHFPASIMMAPNIGLRLTDVTRGRKQQGAEGGRIEPLLLHDVNGTGKSRRRMRQLALEVAELGLCRCVFWRALEPIFEVVNVAVAKWP